MGDVRAVAQGPIAGNPLVDVRFTVRFRQPGTEIEVEGFYDGDGIYRARFMPESPGDWSYRTESSAPELDGTTGRLTCIPPSTGNHGPVRVSGKFHFSYADGTRYSPFGTTCYAWTHQGDALEERTLRTLHEAPFNKMRMCVFPKSYAYNENEPVYYPFARDAAGRSDFSRPNPAFFRNCLNRVCNSSPPCAGI